MIILVKNRETIRCLICNGKRCPECERRRRRNYYVSRKRDFIHDNKHCRMSAEDVFEIPPKMLLSLSQPSSSISCHSAISSASHRLPHLAHPYFLASVLILCSNKYLMLLFYVLATERKNM